MHCPAEPSTPWASSSLKLDIDLRVKWPSATSCIWMISSCTPGTNKALIHWSTSSGCAARAWGCHSGWKGVAECLQREGRWSRLKGWSYRTAPSTSKLKGGNKIWVINTNATLVIRLLCWDDKMATGGHRCHWCQDTKTPPKRLQEGLRQLKTDGIGRVTSWKNKPFVNR